MRWTLAFLTALVVLGGLFLASPYVALYRLAGAVEARDVSALQSRVNLRAVRISLTRQLVATWLDENGKRDPQARRAQGKAPSLGAAGVGATVADPIVAELISPDALIGLLEAGWPTGVLPGEAPPARTGSVTPRGLGTLGRLLIEAETRGFRVITFPLPPGAPAAERLRLVFRLQGFRWRLTGIDLPEGMKRRLVREMPKEFG